MKRLQFLLRWLISPLSMGVTVVLDLVWVAPEAASVLTVVGPLILSIVLFFVCGVVVALIQHYVDKDEWRVAVIKGLALGIIAGVPFCVTSLVFGGIYGALHKLLQLITKTGAQTVGEFILAWRAVEQAVKQAARQGGCPTIGNRLEVGNAISFLAEQGYIDPAQALELRKAAKTRNIVVHDWTPTNIATLATDTAALAVKYKEFFRTHPISVEPQLRRAA